MDKKWQEMGEAPGTGSWLLLKNGMGTQKKERQLLVVSRGGGVGGGGQKEALGMLGGQPAVGCSGGLLETQPAASPSVATQSSLQIREDLALLSLLGGCQRKGRGAPLLAQGGTCFGGGVGLNRPSLCS